MRLTTILDEIAHAGPEHLDPTFVAGFDRKQGADPAPDVALLRRLGLAADATVVDLAAGTGTFAAAIAPHCARVVAVDVSPAMTAAMRQRVAAEALTNVEVVRAGFLSYEHRGAAPAVVHTRHALHQLPDFWKVVALERIAGILEPGGILRLRDLVVDAAPAQVAQVVEAWLASGSSDAGSGYTREDYVEHLATEHSTYRWLLEPMLEAAGFEIEEVDYRLSMYGAYVCVRR